jgi:hypothetical protein
MISSMERDTRRGRPFLRHPQLVARARTLQRVSLSLALAFSASIVFGACSADRVAGPSSQLTTGKLRPSNAVIGEADNFPIDDSGEINCNNGEEVPFSGHMMINVHTTTSGNFHLLFSTHTTVDGTGAFGNVYHGSSEDNFDINNPGTTGFEETLVHNVNLQSATAPDMKVKILAHVTVTPMLKWTAYVDVVRNNCDEIVP